jgi:uncharacterized protein YabN with tetrapyrrole methylase and pyrophosphatase domain
MNDDRRLRADIAIVGLGVSGVHQITREVEETLRRCNETFITDMGVGVVEYLETLSPKVTDLTSRYEAGNHRILIYRRMASEVVAAALEHPPVAFATYGHPRMFCYPTTLIQRAATVLDLAVEVLPGISFLDTLLAELGIDPGFDGLQIYEATDLVVRRRPLQTDVNCVITQGPIVMDAYNRQGEPSDENVGLLQEYLLEFYPADHEAVFVVSKTHPLLDSIKQAVPIGKLATALQQGASVGTLFVPPVRHREVAVEELADRMKLPSESDTRGRRRPRRPGRPKIGPKPAS